MKKDSSVPRLIMVIGGSQPNPRAERILRFLTLEVANLDPVAPLRADLVILDPWTVKGKFARAAQKLSALTHDAGRVLLVRDAFPLMSALKKVGFLGKGRTLRKRAIPSPSQYDEAYLARWGKTDFLKNARLAAEQILAHLPKGFTKRTVRVLDVGCLNGYIMEALHRAGVRHVFGTDISYDLAVRHQINPYHLPAITIGEFQRNSYPDEFSDLTICMEVLEHIPPKETDAFVGELARVTSSRGVVLISASEDWAIDPTHVNCRNRAEWYFAFSQHGLIPVGSQIIFPGFNSFVLQKSPTSPHFLFWQFWSGVQLVVKGRLPHV